MEKVGHPPKRAFPRKRLVLINREFQLRLTKAAVLVGALTTALTSVLILYPLYVFEILRIPRYLPTPILGAMGIAAVINILAIAVLAVFLTHRIAGPMYALHRAIRSLQEGLLPRPIRVRENDELKFIIRNFNEMVEQIQTAGDQDRELCDKLLLELERQSNDQLLQSMEIVRVLKERLDVRLRRGEAS